MKIQDNKPLIFSCFISLLVLAGCGLKGDLYQTPASTKGDISLSENAKKVIAKKTTQPTLNETKSTEKTTPDIEQEFK